MTGSHCPALHANKQGQGLVAACRRQHCAEPRLIDQTDEEEGSRRRNEKMRYEIAASHQTPERILHSLIQTSDDELVGQRCWPCCRRRVRQTVTVRKLVKVDVDLKNERIALLQRVNHFLCENVQSAV